MHVSDAKFVSHCRSSSNSDSSGHHDPKYLGSTGFLPALQTYLCRWNNTCHNRSRTNDMFRDNTNLWQQWFNFSDQVSQLLDDPQISGSLTELVSQIDQLSDYTNIWNGKMSWSFDSSPRDFLNIFRHNPSESKFERFQSKYTLHALHQSSESLESAPILVHESIAEFCSELQRRIGDLSSINTKKYVLRSLKG